MNYYNDNDPRSAAWLRELIKHNVIPPGDIDERSIIDVTGSDLTGYTQVHMFAGIGGWAEALRLAGVNPEIHLWTGSCPCQPFSCAGKRKGEKDSRHLWPEFYRLIRECKPDLIFGEQVEAAIGKGWLDGVFADLETEGYTCGAAVLGAHSAGAPHIRQRLYWVADSTSIRCQSHGKLDARERMGSEQEGSYITENSNFGGMDYSISDGRRTQRDDNGEYDREQFNTDGHYCGPGGGDFWSDSIWLPCADGKARRTQPEIFPLVIGLPGRVGLLRGAGNAICPQTAAEFIKTYLEVTNGNP